MAGDRPGHAESTGRVSPRAFLTQYLTLMLIVLSFMVGSFVTKSVEQSRNAARSEAVVPAPEIKVTPAPIDRFILAELFKPHSALIEEDRAEALRTVLKSHDLYTEITVFADEGVLGSDAITLAASRGLAVKRALEVPEIPADSVKVFGSGDTRGTVAEISFLKTAEGAR